MERALFDRAPVALLVLDRHGAILDLNPATAHLLGVSAANVVGCSLASFVQPGGGVFLTRLLQALDRPGATSSTTLSLRHADGTARPVRVEGSASDSTYAGDDAFAGGDGVTGTTGDPLRLHLALIPAAPAPTVEKSSLLAHLPALPLLQQLPLPALVYAEDGALLFANAACAASTGIPAESLSTLAAWSARCCPTHTHAAAADLKAFCNRGDAAHLGEHTVSTRNGRTATWDLFAVPFGPLADGRRAVLCLAVDLTRHRRAETQLREERDQADETARRKSAFLANMSHEIRTPLTAIIGFATVLAAEVSGDHREFAELIEESGKRLLETLNSVLDLARLEAGQVTLALEPVDVAHETRSIALLLEPLAQQKGLQLRFAGTEHAYALLDRGAFARVVHNLAGNALKFTREGTVTLRVTTSETDVHLNVEDTGPGIDPAFLPHLFDEFRQEHGGVEEHHAGSGLGLAITKRLVALLNGTIAVESRAGSGTTFTVTLPRADATSAEHDRSTATAPALPRARILMVEDQLEIGVMIQHVLADRFDVTLAQSVDEALAAARRTPFDLILADIDLGTGPSGIDLLRALRAMPAYHTVPVAAVTAYALPGDRERFLQERFTAYLSKPFSVDELLRLVSELLTASTPAG